MAGPWRSPPLRTIFGASGARRSPWRIGHRDPHHRPTRTDPGGTHAGTGRRAPLAGAAVCRARHRSPRRARHAAGRPAATRHPQGRRGSGGAAGRRHRGKATHPDRRRLRLRRRHRLRGRPAGAAPVRRHRGLPGAEPFRHRLRPVARGGASRGRDEARPDRHRGQRHRQRRRRGGSAASGHRHADHRSPSAGPGTAGGGGDRQSQPAGLRLSEQGHGRCGRHVLRHAGAARGTAPARRFCRTPGAEPGLPCSTWWRWAPSPTSCRWTATTASWSPKAWRASAKAACSRASRPCSPSPAATRRAPEPSISASPSARASMPPAGWPTCRWASRR